MMDIVKIFLMAIIMNFLKYYFIIIMRVNLNFKVILIVDFTKIKEAIPSAKPAE